MMIVKTCIMPLLLLVFLSFIAEEHACASPADHETLTTADHDVSQVALTTVDPDLHLVAAVATGHVTAAGRAQKVKTGLGGSVAKPEDRDMPTETHHGLTAPKPLRLSIQDYIKLVKDKNEQILAQQLELQISREAVKGARSIFEPEVVGSYQHEDTEMKYTEEEKRELFFFPIENRDERNKIYNVGLEGLIPTGGRINIGYTLKHMSNLFNRDIGAEYQTTLGATVTQPLLKGGGVKPTMANIRVAEADSDIAFQMYRQEMMQVVSYAAAAYWDLYLAQEKYRIRKDSVKIAEQILRDNRERFKFGKMAETEVLEAEAGLALRKSLESEAKQDLISAMNNVRTFISSSAVDTGVAIEVSDSLEGEGLEPHLGVSLEKAFSLRPDYVSTRKKLEREDIRIAYAKNQRWPQLDLKGSYMLNGLEDSTGKSWDDALEQDYRSWTVGVELRIPLVGGIKTRSELTAAKYKKRQALLEIKALEVAVANAVHTAIRNLSGTRDQVRQYATVVNLDQRLLEVELLRLEAGKSNSRLVLEKEEDLNEAKDSQIESIVKNKKAILGLQLAEGSLLLGYGIEVMEAGL